MSIFDLTKPEKKLARQIIDKGLQKDYINGIKQHDAIIEKWKNGKLNNQDAYVELYQSVKKYDKFIARRYDNMKGSTYLIIIGGQLTDGIISEEDIAGFREEIRDWLISFKKMNEEE